METPDIVTVGGSVRLVSLEALAKAFGYNGPGPAGSLLERQGVPTEVINGKRFFNLASLERAIYLRLAPEDQKIDLETGDPCNVERTLQTCMGIQALMNHHLKESAVKEWLSRLRPLSRIGKCLQRQS